VIGRRCGNRHCRRRSSACFGLAPRRRVGGHAFAIRLRPFGRGKLGRGLALDRLGVGSRARKLCFRMCFCLGRTLRLERAPRLRCGRRLFRSALLGRLGCGPRLRELGCRACTLLVGALRLRLGRRAPRLVRLGREPACPPCKKADRDDDREAAQRPDKPRARPRRHRLGTGRRAGARNAVDANGTRDVLEILLALPPSRRACRARAPRGRKDHASILSRMQQMGCRRRRALAARTRR
jgi:hypothetical protein